MRSCSCYVSRDGDGQAFHEPTLYIICLHSYFPSLALHDPRSITTKKRKKKEKKKHNPTSILIAYTTKGLTTLTYVYLDTYFIMWIPCIDLSYLMIIFSILVIVVVVVRMCDFLVGSWSPIWTRIFFLIGIISRRSLLQTSRHRSIVFKACLTLLTTCARLMGVQRYVPRNGYRALNSRWFYDEHGVWHPVTSNPPNSIRVRYK